MEVCAYRGKELLAAALEALPACGALILSDYGKGVLTPRVIEDLIAAARRANVPVIVDPKGNDYSLYRGATLVTPNRKELGDAVRRDVTGDDDIAAAATELCGSIGCKAMLVTRSDEGMTLVEKGRAPVHVPAYPVKIGDVSGAGDTVIAVLATMLAAHTELELAMRAANAAAAVVVGKRGTATVSHTGIGNLFGVDEATVSSGIVVGGQINPIDAQCVANVTNNDLLTVTKAPAGDLTCVVTPLPNNVVNTSTQRVRRILRR